MNRAQFVEMFSSKDKAVAFEDAALSIGDEYLPTCAQAVRDGAEPTPEYWQWLCNEVERTGTCEDALSRTPLPPLETGRAFWSEGYGMMMDLNNIAIGQMRGGVFTAYFWGSGAELPDWLPWGSGIEYIDLTSQWNGKAGESCESSLDYKITAVGELGAALRRLFRRAHRQLPTAREVARVRKAMVHA